MTLHCTMAACWTRRIPLDTMLHTTLLPASRGELVMHWLEETLGQDADLAVLQTLNIVWIHSVATEQKEDKTQNWKLAGCAKTMNLGSFVFAIDEVERLGRWGEVEGRDKPRLEHRIATGHLPNSTHCSDLGRAAELLAAHVFTAVFKASKNEVPRNMEPRSSIH